MGRWLGILTLGILSVTVAKAGEMVDYPKTFSASRSFVIEAIDGKVTGPIECRSFASDTDLVFTYSIEKRAVMVKCPTARRLPLAIVGHRDGKEIIELIDIEITGKGVLPTPPAPKPDPKPPIVPDKTFSCSFAKDVYDEAMRVESVDRSYQAKKIIEALESVKSKIVAGGLDTTKTSSVIKEISAQTGSQPAVWKPWVAWWNKAGKEHWTKNSQMPPENWIELLNSTIEGLAAVK